MVGGDRIIDVQFADFASDPFATIGSIYERMGRETHAACRKADARTSFGQPGRRRRQPYSWPTPDWTPRCCASARAPYQERFNVPTETLR